MNRTIVRPYPFLAQVPRNVLGLAMSFGSLLASSFSIATAEPPPAADFAYQEEWTSLSSETVDAIIASVGGEILMLSDLQRAIFIASRGQASLTPEGEILGSGITPEDCREVFDQLVDQAILELKVSELGLSVTQTELEREIDQFLQSRQISREDFVQMLEREGETEQSHRSEFKRQLETQRFIGRNIRPLVVVSDDEVRSYMASQGQGNISSSGELYVLRSLLIENDSAQKSEQTELKIQAVQEGIASGSPFEELTKTFSDASDARQTGGLLEPRKLNTLPPQLAEKLIETQPGGVIGPLNIGSSIFFFEFVEKKSAANRATPGESKNLDAARAELQEKKFAERLQSYLEAERKKVNIKLRPFHFKLSGS